MKPRSVTITLTEPVIGRVRLALEHLIDQHVEDSLEFPGSPSGSLAFDAAAIITQTLKEFDAAVDNGAVV